MTPGHRFRSHCMPNFVLEVSWYPETIFVPVNIYVDDRFVRATGYHRLTIQDQFSPIDDSALVAHDHGKEYPTHATRS